MSSPDLLVWIDLEMSGLDVEQCRILEIATLVTDQDLEVVAEGPELVVHQPNEVLDAMDAWNTEHHGESGLTERVRSSKISEQEAEAQTLAFLVDQVKAGASPLCGNSVHNDRNFLDRYMPRITEHVHYRNIDVSTVKELARRWYGDAARFKKKGAHRALDDIRESIAELAFYRRNFFTKP